MSKWLIVIGILSASPVRADTLLEPPRPRQGYYVAVGGHAAAPYVLEDGEGLGPFVGWGVDLRFGQLLTRRFGMG